MGGRRRQGAKAPLGNATNRQQAPRTQPVKQGAAAVQSESADTQTSDMQQLESDYESFARAKAKLHLGMTAPTSSLVGTALRQLDSSAELGAASERSIQPPEAGHLRQDNAAIKERLRLALAAAKKVSTLAGLRQSKDRQPGPVLQQQPLRPRCRAVRASARARRRSGGCWG